MFKVSNKILPEVEDLSPIVSSLNHKKDLFAVLLHNVLPEQECQDLIDRTETMGYEAALVNVGGGRQVAMNDIRNSDRIIVDDPDYVERIYQRILQKLQYHHSNLELYQKLLDWRKNDKRQKLAVGLNERMRILRYDPGCYFKPHSDGSYRRGYEAGLSRHGEMSEVTLLLYLNEGYEGGRTRFLSPHSSSTASHYDVVPQTGSVLLFEHACYHEGATLLQGRKYILRTDVMYTTKGPGLEYSGGLNLDRGRGSPGYSD